MTTIKILVDIVFLVGGPIWTVLMLRKTMPLNFKQTIFASAVAFTICVLIVCYWHGKMIFERLLNP